MTVDDGGWNEYRRLVMQNFEEIKSRLTNLEASMTSLRESVTILKVKAAMWAAAVAFLITAVIQITIKVLWR